MGYKGPRPCSNLQGKSRSASGKYPRLTATVSPKLVVALLPRLTKTITEFAVVTEAAIAEKNQMMGIIILILIVLVSFPFGSQANAEGR